MKESIFVSLVICLMVVHSSAEIVAGWDVAGVDLDDGIGVVSNIAPYVFYSTTNESMRVEAVLTLGDGVICASTENQYGFKIPGALQTNSLMGAISQNHFMEFSITVEDGYQLNLDSIEMTGQSSEGTGCTNVVLMSSIAGFVDGAQLASATNANTTGGFDTDPQWVRSAD